MDIQIITDKKEKSQTFKEDLRRLKLKFLYDASPLDMSEAIEDGDLRREEFEPLYKEIQDMKEKGMSFNELCCSARYRVSIDSPGDYDISMTTADQGQQIRIMRLR